MAEEVNFALKTWIDSASYEELLTKWRFAKIGDPFFQGATGAYYAKVMRKRRDEVGDTNHTVISKRVGWKDGVEYDTSA